MTYSTAASASSPASRDPGRHERPVRPGRPPGQAPRPLHLRRMSALVRQYADLRLGGTDASVVAVCERLGIVTVATVNLRDFATVRPRHVPAFIIVPVLD